jgi:hypothetical protein
MSPSRLRPMTRRGLLAGAGFSTPQSPSLAPQISGQPSHTPSQCLIHGSVLAPAAARNVRLLCRQVYDKVSPGYRGRCTAPLLLDKKTKRIISSESPEILATLFHLQLPGSTDVDLAPPHLEAEANQLKALIYNQVSPPAMLPPQPRHLSLQIVTGNLCDSFLRGLGWSQL